MYEKLNNTETTYINKNKTIDYEYGYNMSTRGANLKRKGWKHSENSKKKISQSLKGQKFTKERKENIRNSLKGKSELGKNFGGPKYGKDHPNFIEINKETEEKIINLHINELKSPKQIAKIIGINGEKIINLLRKRNKYIKYSEICKLRKEKNFNI